MKDWLGLTSPQIDFLLPRLSIDRDWTGLVLWHRDFCSNIDDSTCRIKSVLIQFFNELSWIYILWNADVPGLFNEIECICRIVRSNQYKLVADQNISTL